MRNSTCVSGSFRDPSGFLFFRNEILYRQINISYSEDYDKLMDSGLYEKLVSKKQLVSHEEVGLDFAEGDFAYKLIQPEEIPFISYPYEWSFSQLKDAALATLSIQKKALASGMCLKDASAYNIQFLRGKPVLIDTLSFEILKKGQPWVAYKQFCQHFLAPLALMAYKDVRLSSLMRQYIDGVPVDIASKLLPTRTKFSPSLLFHIHLVAKAQAKYADKPGAKKKTKMQFSERAFEGLIDNLTSLVKKLKWAPKGTEWGDYYDDTNYTDNAQEHKKELVLQFIEKSAPKRVWDLGGNVGLFSRIASDKGINTVCFDIDPAAVEKNYRQCVARKETHILPLVQDLTNPSPGIGWHHDERMSLIDRGPVDTAMALALIHHLAISNNLPFDKIAKFFSEAGRYLIIEFVPKSDSQVQRLLASREDIFIEYDQTHFEKAFEEYFVIKDSVPVRDSERTLYLMKTKSSQE